MEFLRFGSSIPGSYWGCCAVDIIQNFKFHPDEKASIQLVNGDCGSPVTNSKGFVYVGPTYHDIFKQRIRIGTFGKKDMPNHIFLAVLTQDQLSSRAGSAWLKILKEEGFEFIRTTDNSVYSGNRLDSRSRSHPNHLFGLFRNIGNARIENPFLPPSEWTDLPKTMTEVHDVLTPSKLDKLISERVEYQTNRWNDGTTVFMTEEQLTKAGVTVTYAGIRSKFPQENKDVRDQKLADEAIKSPKVSAFPGADVMGAEEFCAEGECCEDDFDYEDEGDYEMSEDINEMEEDLEC